MRLLAKAFMFLYDRSTTVRAVVVKHQFDRDIRTKQTTERYHDRLRKLYGDAKFNEFKKKGMV